MMNCILMAQNVGIGTNQPQTRLHVEQGTVLFKGPALFPATPGPLPVSGAGVRLLWYPGKAAFRAGVVTGSEWDADSIGNFSVAMGESSKASANGTVAMGIGTIASGYAAVSFGFSCNAAGFGSLAMGNGTIAFGSNTVSIGTSNRAMATNAVAIGVRNLANGIESMAMGSLNTCDGSQTVALGSENAAAGNRSTAIGTDSRASGEYAIVLGNSSSASSSYAVSIGKSVTASGANSVSLGNYVSTSGYVGAFALGDASTTTVMQSFVANGFRARFAGGYRLFTNSAVTIGAFLNANANSWAALSDVRMKENFLPVDGEVILRKIAAMPQYTWNYIGQDVASLRHYGPMAQDFYQAFGRDGLGEIGCDTLINQQDFLGVSYIAIQSLEKRTTQLATENTLLKNKLLLLEEDNKKLADKLLQLSEKLEAAVRSMKEQSANETITSTRLVE